MMRVHRLWFGPLAAATCFACQAGCQHTETVPAGQVTTMAATTPAGQLTGRQIADVKVAMGAALENQRDLPRAAEAYQDALTHDSSRSDAYRGLARIRDQQGHFAESLDLYRKALAASPGNADVYCDMGYSLYLQRNWSEAEKNLRQAVAINADHVRARNNLALVLAFSDRTDEALAEFRRGGSSEADAQLNIAFALAMERHFPEACQRYQLALSADPNSASARRGLAEVNAALAKLSGGTATAKLSGGTATVAAGPAPTPVRQAEDVKWFAASNQPAAVAPAVQAACGSSVVLAATPTPVDRSLLASPDASSTTRVSPAQQPVANQGIAHGSAASPVKPAYALVPMCEARKDTATPCSAVVVNRQAEDASWRSSGEAATPACSAATAATGVNCAQKATVVNGATLGSHSPSSSQGPATAQQPATNPSMPRNKAVAKPTPMAPACDKTTIDRPLPPKELPVASAPAPRESAGLEKPCTTRICSMESAPCCGALVPSSAVVEKKTVSADDAAATTWKKAPSQSPNGSTNPPQAGGSTAAPRPADKNSEVASGEQKCIRPLDEFEKNLRRQIAEGRDGARAHRDLAVLLAGSSRLDEALAEFRRAGCSERDAQMYLAAALRTQCRWRDVRLHCIYALTADPDCDAAKRMLEEANDKIMMTATTPLNLPPQSDATTIGSAGRSTSGN